MSKYGFDGLHMASNDAQVSRAYCAGRTASYAAAAIGTNPHVTNTPEWQAWRSGHVSYAAGGTNTVQDTCDRPAKFVNPAVTAAVDALEISGARWKFTPAAPGLPFAIEFGDGSGYQNPPGITTPILHTYAESGSYVTRLHYMGRIWDSETITVTIT